MKRTCRQCGASCELSDSEIRYFQQKGLELPKRCQACRKRNRNTPAAATVRVSKAASWWTPGKIAAIAGAAVLLTAGGIFAAVLAGKSGAAPERIAGTVRTSLPRRSDSCRG